ncbi:MAG: hypothetical protein ACI4J1_11995 [Ruminiclostridium sp.]
MHIKAGLKKEYLLFSRTFKLWGILIAFMAFAIVDPLLFKALEVFAESMGSNVDAGELVAQSMGAVEFSAGIGVMGALSDITASGSLIMLLLMMATAGGEQKKRSVIIPSCAGLTPMNYTLPKFIIYPVLIVIITFGATIVSAVTSILLFGGQLDWLAVMGAGGLGALYMAFIVTAMLMMGICTGRGGISAAVIYVLSSLLPIILSGFKADRYNPFALKTMALNIPLGEEIDSLNLIGSIAITVILMLIFFFVTLFVQNAKKIDNEGNEAAL